MKLKTVRAKDFMQEFKTVVLWLDGLDEPILHMRSFGDGIYYVALTTCAGQDKLPFMLRFAADAIEREVESGS